MLPTAVSTTTTTTTTGGGGGPITDMDLTKAAAAAVHQPMDWLFKKERIYWLAQFWQQKAILAEKEVSTLKEQLTIPTTETITTTTTTTEPNIDSIEFNKSSIDLINTKSSLESSILSSFSPNSTSILNTLPLLNGCTNPLNGSITTTTATTGISSLLTSNLNLNLNGNFIATAPSPSPPLSDNESVTSVNNTNCNEIINNNNNNINNNNNNNNKIIDNNNIIKNIENNKIEIISKEENDNNIMIIDNENEIEKCIKSSILIKKSDKENLNNDNMIIVTKEDNIKDDVNNRLNNNNNNINSDNKIDDNDNCKKLDINLKINEINKKNNDDVLLIKDINIINEINNHHKNDIELINALSPNNNNNNITKTNMINFNEKDEKILNTNNNLKCIEKENIDENKKENEESEKIQIKLFNNENIKCDLRNNNLKEELNFKDKEIKILSDEVNRLKMLYEQQILINQRLQDNLEQKLNVILRLESTDDNPNPISIPNNSLNNKINQSISQLSLEENDIAKNVAVVARDEEEEEEDEEDVVIVKEEKSDSNPMISPHPTPLENDENLNTTNSKLDNHLIEKESNERNNSVRNQRDIYDSNYNLDEIDSHNSLSNRSTPINHQFRYNDEQRSIDLNILSPFTGKMNLTENAANSLQQMAATGPLSGAHMPNPFQTAGLQFAFSTGGTTGLQSHQDRTPFSRFSDDLHVSGSRSDGGSNSTSGRYNTDLLIPKSDPMEAKLQEMLRYGLDKFANHNLDTLYISRRVRELLSIHNIGQRIFAKYVLGLSQGTVSELLSKPKPWDKLTEKGRDSYRKMHAWACDDAAILLLKSLIPKKDSNMPQFSYADERYPEDRMSAYVLADSLSPPMLSKSTIHNSLGNQSFLINQKSMQSKDDDSRSNDDMRSSINMNRSSPPLPPPPSSSSSSSNKEPKITINSVIQEQASRLDYQEELAKLMSRNQREGNTTPAFPGFLFPQLYGGNAGNGSASLPPNLEVALETYHRELAKLQNRNGTSFPNFTELLALQQSQATMALNGSAVQDLSVTKEILENLTNDNRMSPKDNFEKNTSRNSELSSPSNLSQTKSEKPIINTSNSRSQTPSKISSPVTSSILTPNSDDFSASINPLQRMASITNSLITQPPLPPLHSQSPRPLKAVLPPITQQQFDSYNNLNTEDIVRNVKEALSQYSISQRLFGENVLGLSQGSVSDLLARPKPWNMLTQKGREPFIRMQMFLEDDSAVHKLVASQYKIAPEKLMRTGSYSGTPQIPTSLATKIDDIQTSPMQKIINDLKLKQESQQQHLMQQMRAANALVNLPTTQHQVAAAAAAGILLTPPPGLMPHYGISQAMINNNLPNSNVSNEGNSNIEKKSPIPIVPISSPQHGNVMRNGHNQHMSPTVYEMAALTQDLDTQIITTKVKEVLLSNNIGQKIFGEAVLGLSQGSVSELLSKPKPWHMLSIKGREPFIRMQLWLSDINNVERLQTLKNEQREASKRRRSIGPGGSHDNSDTSSNDTNDFYTTSPGPGSVGSNGVPPNKKQRVLFSEEQKEALRLAFTLDPYPNVTTIEFLANELGLATRTITNWFHNHRMRLKQQMPHGQPTEPIPTRENQTGPPLDPVQFKILLNQRLMEMQKDRIGLSGGVPLIYPPYFGSNPNLAALIAGRGLFPNTEPDLQALNAALKGQFNGIDLSMSHNNNNNNNNNMNDNNNIIKEENFQDFRDDNDLKNHNDDDLSDDSESINKSEINDNNHVLNRNDDDNNSLAALINANIIRASRRKASAPQWVNPDWQPKSLFQSTNFLNGNTDELQEEATDFSRKSINDIDNIEKSIISDRISQNRSPILSADGVGISIKTEKLDTKLSNDSDVDERNESVLED